MTSKTNPVSTAIANYRKEVATKEGDAEAKARGDVLEAAWQLSVLANAKWKTLKTIPSIDDETDPTTDGKAWRPRAYLIAQMLADDTLASKIDSLGFPTDLASLKEVVATIRNGARDSAFGRPKTRTRRGKPKHANEHCQTVCKTIFANLETATITVKASARFKAW